MSRTIFKQTTGPAGPGRPEPLGQLRPVAHDLWGGMVKLLADRYLGAYSPKCEAHPPEDREYHGSMFKRSVAEWVATIERHVDLEADPHYEETWT